ncbi:LOW QUALITY PROTEIN: PPR domain-containing protein/PPR_2 domain-containing protein, partial [Cephalotus follicularis]
LGEGRFLFDRMPRRDCVSWNTMISGYARNGRMDEALLLFNSIHERNVVSWNAMVTRIFHNGDVAHAIVSDMEEASKLFHPMPNPDTPSWNSMISRFAHMSSLEVARTFFERMPQRNLYSWNSMIAGHEKNEDYEGTIKLFTQMQVEGEKPGNAGLMDLHLGMQIHLLVTKKVTPYVPINNSLITMYSRCGPISEARTTFDEMQLQKDVISNAMIGGYASHGFAAEALELFELMTRIRLHPTYITFIAILNSCVQEGLVDEGRRHFRSMVSEYGIMPRVEHFASLVDLLGLHGKLDEAMELINSMPYVPDKAVGALLGTCRVHNNIEFARVATEALMRLESESSVPYLLLHNMFADVGKW